MMPGTSEISASSVTIMLCLAISGCSTIEDPQITPASAGPLAGNTVEHTTVRSAREALPLPKTVSEVAWVWEAPDDRVIRAVHPTSTGAVMELDNGMVSLNTSTGEETWSFLLPEHRGVDEETDVSVSPDGSMIAFSPGQSMVLLDTGSGQEVARLGHTASGPSQFTVDGAGLIGDQGLFTVEFDHDAHISLTPWQEDGQEWKSTIPACDETEIVDVSQGVLTHDQMVIEYSCPFQEPVTVGVDQSDGQELWRLTQGKDYSPDPDIFPAPIPSAEYDFGVVGDLIVLQNISEERGTVVIDSISGQVLNDKIPSTTDTPLLRVLPDGYMTVRESKDEDSDDKILTYELREFNGDLKREIVISTDVTRGSLNNFLVLEDSLLKIRMVEENEEQDMAVLPWDGTEDLRVPLPIEVDTTGIPSIARADREVGPSTFLASPGAIILREFPGNKVSQRTVGMK